MQPTRRAARVIITALTLVSLGGCRWLAGWSSIVEYTAIVASEGPRHPSEYPVVPELLQGDTVTLSGWRCVSEYLSLGQRTYESRGSCGPAPVTWRWDGLLPRDTVAALECVRVRPDPAEEWWGVTEPLVVRVQVDGPGQTFGGGIELHVFRWTILRVADDSLVLHVGERRLVPVEGVAADGSVERRAERLPTFDTRMAGDSVAIVERTGRLWRRIDRRTAQDSLWVVGRRAGRDTLQLLRWRDTLRVPVVVRP